MAIMRLPLTVLEADPAVRTQLLSRVEERRPAFGDEEVKYRGSTPALLSCPER
jgi:hypothetical protein